MERGYSVLVAASGVVEPGPEWWPPWLRLTLSPRSAARLAALGLPVSFTVLARNGEAAEGPLAWLD
ncbi:hypothetical protein [Streptomyces sp. NPDC046887]|uniref:hypothetical protein n=1 Tax=Streptomyces sp. NPDC046887 TaxID=3155472 RepID=UPI0033C525D3